MAPLPIGYAPDSSPTGVVRTAHPGYRETSPVGATVGLGECLEVAHPQ